MSSILLIRGVRCKVNDTMLKEYIKTKNKLYATVFSLGRCSSTKLSIVQILQKNIENLETKILLLEKCK